MCGAILADGSQEPRHSQPKNVVTRACGTVSVKPARQEWRQRLAAAASGARPGLRPDLGTARTPGHSRGQGRGAASAAGAAGRRRASRKRDQGGPLGGAAGASRVRTEALCLGQALGEARVLLGQDSCVGPELGCGEAEARAQHLRLDRHLLCCGLRRCLAVVSRRSAFSTFARRELWCQRRGARHPSSAAFVDSAFSSRSRPAHLFPEEAQMKVLSWVRLLHHRLGGLRVGEQLNHSRLGPSAWPGPTSRGCRSRLESGWCRPAPLPAGRSSASLRSAWALRAFQRTPARARAQRPLFKGEPPEGV